MILLRLKVPDTLYATINEVRNRRQLLTNGSLTPPSSNGENDFVETNDNDSVHSLP